ncbi:unnamed protein product [Rhizoctonia solani]|uniref:Major facilitator superfamily (MFS) profile domain-containing protein n=1 Tax=Rhizoctonia solani TaxID=456999 RepID=A0A8H3HJJ6_9AGAM|nr:unnamed protein product [Rhizoctonia solani]
MREQAGLDAHVNELDIDKEQVENSAEILEALPSLPITRATTATAGISSTSPTIVNYNIPPAQIPTKKRNLYFVSAFCSLGGFLFGADTGSIGSITSMPQFIEVYPTLKNEAVLGALVATILMSASLASFASGWLSDKYSLGEGFFLSAIGVYLVEIAPPDGGSQGSTVIFGLINPLFLTTSSRAYLVHASTLWYIIPLNTGRIKLNIPRRFSYPSHDWHCTWLFHMLRFSQHPIHAFLAHTIHNPGRSGDGSRDWYAIASLQPQVAIPKRESRRSIEAFDRHSSSEKEKEELIARAQERQGQDEAIGVVEAFRDPESRGRTLLAVFMMGMQQLSGIDGVLFYGPILFSQAGLTSRQASFLASGVSGILNIVCTIPAQLYLLDKWGRRSSAIVGGLVMAVCMLAIGSMYAAGADAGQGRYAIIVFIYLFVIAFSTTWAVSFKLFITEIQPTRARATASSLAHSSNWLCNLAVALTTPLFLSRSSSGPYFMFGACLLLTSVVCMVWMPETLGKSLQEVDEVWEARMKKSKEIIHSLVTFGVGRQRRNSAYEMEIQSRGRV